MAIIRSVRTMVMIVVPILVLMSLHFSSSRWRALQEELEKKEMLHSVEVEKLEQQIAKARQTTTKCSSEAKESVEKVQLRYQQKLAKLDLEIKTREDKIKKADLKIKEVEKEDKDKDKDRGKLTDKLSKQEQALQSKEEELSQLKEESILALKASRDRAGVLRRGLQGSAALLAEKNVLIEQFNVTLLSALYHMEKDQRAAAAQSAAALGLPSKERKATMQRLTAKDVDLEKALDRAVQIFQYQRSEHSRLAQEFVNATRKERERQQQEKDREEAEAKAKVKEAKEAVSSNVVSEAADLAAKTDAALKDPKKESKGVPGSRKPQGDGSRKPKAGKPDPLDVAKSIVPVDELTEEQTTDTVKNSSSSSLTSTDDAETVKGGSQQGQGEAEEEEEDGESFGDLDFLGEADPQVLKQKEEEEKLRKQRIDRAMQKETTRQEQAKYWAKYHKQNQRKQGKLKSEGGDETEADSVD